MNTNPLLKKKIFLYITEFLTGIAVMGVETAASRLLAPYFSSSQVVWTLIIGTILIAMSIGNFLGGKMADKHPDVTLLYTLMLISGAYICLVPFVGRFIIAGVTAVFAVIVSSGLLIWASLFSCLILFVPPLLVLGMLTPSLIKYSMGETSSGKIVGSLESLNTLGSIIGTFIPTFITIPTVGTSITFAIFGGLLCAIALTFIITGIINDRKNKLALKEENKEEDIKNEDSDIVVEITKKKQFRKRVVISSVATTFALLGIILSFMSGFVFWGDDEVVYEDESIYNYLQIKEDESAIYFSTNVMFGVQSMIKKDDSLTGMYYDYALAAPYMANVIEKGSLDVLILGNGTGTYAKLLKDYVPYDMNIIGVEIDQEIIDLSYSTFRLPEDVKVYCDDARAYLNRSKDKYDIIMVDAYSSISVPFQMATTEFFGLVDNHLKDDGVMIMNINMKSDDKSSMDKALCDTSSKYFNELYHFNVPGGTNDEIFASKSNEAMSNLNDSLSYITNSSLRYRLNRVLSESTLHEDSGIRLTDDNADVELRSMLDIDVIINDELDYYKSVFKEKGLSGLLKAIM